MASLFNSLARRLTWRSAGLGGGIGLILIVALAVYVFQDNIARFALTPRTPFQLSPAPNPPDPKRIEAWALWPSDRDVDADLFFIHSTTFYSAKAWNAHPLDTNAYDELRMRALPNEAGPFLGLGAVYAPRYRQATLATVFTHKYDGEAARRLAFDDVDRAFGVFLAETEKRKRVEERPLALIGYGQGALHAMGLLAKHFDGADNPLRKRLAAAYLIDFPAPADFFASFEPALPACDEALQTGCVVAYFEREARFSRDIARARRRTLAWRREAGTLAERPYKDPTLVCVNPLTWRRDGPRAEPRAHIGAASATGIALGARPPAVSQAIGAACVDGVLIVDRPRPAYLRRSPAFAEKWKAQSFNLFYHDLAANARLRIDAHAAALFEAAQTLAPISETVDVVESPIRKVPKTNR